jgi:phenylacetate-CoA ligase
LHVNAHDFVVEVVEGARREPSGRRAASGRLLVTDLRNFAAPKLRYEVGDLAAWGPAGVCPCGRSWPRLASILGRDSEVVVTPSGREILVTALSWGGMFRAVPEMPDLVWDYQFREHAPGDIEVCVVPTPAFSADHASRIAAGLGAYAGQEIRFRVTTVSAIPAAGLGEKPRLLVRNDTAHSQP